jgi:hypothetical protein
MAGPGRSNAFVFCGIAFADWQGFLPVFPVPVVKLNGDGGADGHSLTDARKDVGGVALDLHAPAAAVALLATPKFAVEEGLVNLQSGGHAGKESDQGFAVGLSRCEVAQHKFSIVPDARLDSTRRTRFGTLENDVLPHFDNPNGGPSGYNELTIFQSGVESIRIAPHRNFLWHK